MSKKKVPDNFMSDFLKSGGKTSESDAQTTDNQLTTDAQTTDTVSTADAQSGETPRRQIRISDPDWLQLTQAAAERGISTSALVRQILREWMRKG